MRQVNPHAAGVDIGAQEIVACVPDGHDRQIVRPFGTSTADLHALAAWCLARGSETVAMESTGVYGMPLCEELAARGLPGCRISAQSSKRVPGRKSDVLDCPGIQTLPRYGLLSASCRPEADCGALRTLRRQRAPLLEQRAPPVLHMQKALWQMNSPLSPALSDVTGTTGLRIIRAIVAGEREPHTLAAWRHDRCKQEADEIARARTGTGREAPLLVLPQALAWFDGYTAQRSACAAQLARACAVIKPRCAPVPAAPMPAGTAPPPRRKPPAHSQNAPEGHPRAHLLRITGGELVAVHGRSASLAQTLLAEIGTDRHTWPDDQHCCAWLGLAPKHDIAGGKVLKSRTMQNRNRATPAFRLAAQSVIRSHCAFGAFSRRLQGRLGPAQALVATAHKIARTVYHMLKDRVPSYASGAAEYNKRFRERELQYLQKKAATLGYTLSPA
jgi:transposase